MNDQILKFYYKYDKTFKTYIFSESHMTHEWCEENLGYMVCFNSELNLVGVAHTFSTVGSVLTIDGLDELSYDSKKYWLFLGTPYELYEIAKKELNIIDNNINLNVGDFDYKVFTYLYDRYIIWYEDNLSFKNNSEMLC